MLIIDRGRNEKAIPSPSWTRTVSPAQRKWNLTFLPSALLRRVPYSQAQYIAHNLRHKTLCKYHTLPSRQENDRAERKKSTLFSRQKTLHCNTMANKIEEREPSNFGRGRHNVSAKKGAKHTQAAYDPTSFSQLNYSLACANVKSLRLYSQAGTSSKNATTRHFTLAPCPNQR